MMVMMMLVVLVQVVQDCVRGGGWTVIGQLRFLSIFRYRSEGRGISSVVRCQLIGSRRGMNAGWLDLWTSCDLLVMFAM